MGHPANYFFFPFFFPTAFFALFFAGAFFANFFGAAFTLADFFFFFFFLGGGTGAGAGVGGGVGVGGGGVGVVPAGASSGISALAFGEPCPVQASQPGPAENAGLFPSVMSLNAAAALAA